jgi:hypothetical protein
MMRMMTTPQLEVMTPMIQTTQQLMLHEPETMIMIRTILHVQCDLGFPMLMARHEPDEATSASS